MGAIFFDRFHQLRWPWKALAIVFGGIFFNIFATILFLTSATNVIATQRNSQLEAFTEANLLATQMEIQAIITILTMGVMLAIVALLVRKAEKRALNWSWLGLPPLRRNLGVAAIGGAIGLTVGLACCIAGLVFGGVHFTAFGIQAFPSAQILNTLFYSLALAVAIAVAEEVAFRGYLQNRLAAQTHPVFALLVTSAVFALAHPWGGEGGALLNLARTGLMGLLLGLLYMKTGNCWAGISTYAVWNFLHTFMVGTHSPADAHFFGAPLVLLEHVADHSDPLLDVLIIGAAVALLAALPHLGKQKPADHRLAAPRIPH